MATVHTIPRAIVIQLASELVGECQSLKCQLAVWADAKTYDIYVGRSAMLPYKCGPSCKLRKFRARILKYIAMTSGAHAVRGDIVEFEVRERYRQSGQWIVVHRRGRADGRLMCVLGALGTRHWEYGHQRSTFLAPTQFSMMHFAKFSRWVFLDEALDWKYESAPAGFPTIAYNGGQVATALLEADPTDNSDVESLNMLGMLRAMFKDVQYTVVVCANECEHVIDPLDIEQIRAMWQRLECRWGTTTTAVAIIPDSE